MSTETKISPKVIKSSLKAQPHYLGKELNVAYVDLEGDGFEHWKNNRSTAVFVLPKKSLKGLDLLDALIALNSDHCDEFHAYPVGKNVIVRMWWD